ncbi:MAG TPA: hypothetical protein VHB73_05945 [Alphaproteobacteria bacterium]|nr:hypothetical protein [Alphaproteobacteria bacterium]
MQISLSPQQVQWLKAQVAQGGFASMEEAVQHIIDERMAVEASDFAWAKPYVDEARAAQLRGEVISLDEHQAGMAEHLEALKS